MEASTSRLEAFSDGVFAIAVTLLILDVGPKGGSGSLAHRLGEAWPSYASFVVSFLVIGTMWINHHDMFRDVARVDHGLVCANLGLLLVVSAIPFPTKLVGDTLASASAADQRTAALLYGLLFVAVSVAFPLLWFAASHDRRLLAEHVTERDVKVTMRRNLLGFPAFSTATLLALWSPYASLAAFGLVTATYLLPRAALDRRLAR